MSLYDFIERADGSVIAIDSVDNFDTALDAIEANGGIALYWLWSPTSKWRRISKEPGAAPTGCSIDDLPPAVKLALMMG